MITMIMNNDPIWKGQTGQSDFPSLRRWHGHGFHHHNNEKNCKLCKNVYHLLIKFIIHIVVKYKL
jgi:hypothetical protein